MDLDLAWDAPPREAVVAPTVRAGRVARAVAEAHARRRVARPTMGWVI